METYLSINTVADYLKLRNQKLQHPLIGIVDFYSKDIPANPGTTPYDGLSFNCFAVFLKDSADCKIKYGGGDYDFDEGTMVFVGPNQKVEITKDKNYKPKGYALLFSPDLLQGSSLELDIKKYLFFSYSVNEALHLSQKEREIIISILNKIQYEIEQKADAQSKKLILSNLTLLLDYCIRFYERQFISRKIPHNSYLTQFKESLTKYFNDNTPLEKGLPTVHYFAQALHLSPNYFGDMIRKETGVSAQEYIQNHLLSVAKNRIENNPTSINEIAYELGFKYPQHFTRLFKKKMGVTPNEYKLSLSKSLYKT